jgi:hypothetical protein
MKDVGLAEDGRPERGMCMRAAFALGLLAALTGLGADPPSPGGTRYGIGPDLKAYPQASAQETLTSVLKAIDAGRFDYLVAQLADPAWVDDRVGRLYGGQLAEQVEDTRARLDAATVKLLRRFQGAELYDIARDHRGLRLNDVGDRGVFFVRKAERWYLENRTKPGT